MVDEALDALADGRPRAARPTGSATTRPSRSALACGGTIRVLVEPVGRAALPEALLAELVAARAARRAVAYAVRRRGLAAAAGRRRAAAAGLDPDAAARFRADRSGLEGDCFIAVHNPPLRLIVVGAVHIAQPLVADGADLRLRPASSIDPREAFGSAARFPGDAILPRLAGRGAGGVRARCAHRGGDADPRSEARRSGDPRGAGARRSSTSAASARPGPMPSGWSG